MALGAEQKDALEQAAKSSKYYPMLNKKGGASSDAWASVKGTYPSLDGIDDAILNAAFMEIKIQGAGRRPDAAGVRVPWQGLQTPVEASVFDTLLAKEKLALVRAVRYGLFEKELKATAGISSDAWANVVKESPDLAGLSVETLDAAAAELLAPPAAPVIAQTGDGVDGAAGGAGGGLKRSGGTLAAVVLVALFLASPWGLSGFQPGNVVCDATSPTSRACEEKLARDATKGDTPTGLEKANGMVERNVAKFMEKSVP